MCVNWSSRADGLKTSTAFIMRLVVEKTLLYTIKLLCCALKVLSEEMVE